MIKPLKLHKGDKIAVVSLSSGMLGEAWCAHQLALGTKRLEAFGLEVVFMPHALKGIDYVLHHPEDRARDLKQAFEDDSINAILCAIGGEETYKTIQYLATDPEFMNLVRTHPKIFLGYSDTTINHFMFNKLGLVTYYGQSFLPDMAELGPDMLPYSKKAFRSLFVNPKSRRIISSPFWYTMRTDFSAKMMGTKPKANQEKYGYEVLRGQGIVKGNLLGGCLESMSDMVSGSFNKEAPQVIADFAVFPSASKWEDKILLMEVSEEYPDVKQLQNYLEDLDKTGIFKAVKAIIVGKPVNQNCYHEFKDILLQITEKYHTPILYNINVGHCHPHAIVAFGLQYEIDFDTKEFYAIEPFFAKK